MDKSFTAFKKDFYSRVDDLRVFDCEEYNLLKVVLDGLKVDYVARGVKYRNIFKPFFLGRIIFFAKRIKYARKIKSAAKEILKLNGLKGRPFLLIDNGRTALSAQGNRVSFYLHRISEVLGRENYITIAEFPSLIKCDTSLPDLMFFTRFRDYSKDERQMIRALKNCYNKIGVMGIFSENELLNIQMAMNKFFNEYRLWDEIVRRVEPRTCIFESHYHKEGCVLALKRNGVKVVELQHGLIAREDIFYVFPEKARSVASRALFPDKIFTYGRFWSEILFTGNEFTRDQVEVIGQYQEISTKLSEDDKRELERFLNGQDFILITTQTFLHEYFLDYINWLSADLGRRKSKMKIVVKPHPSEQWHLYDTLTSLENVLITEANTEYLLSKCAMQVSIYSTTLFEGLKYGCRNFSLKVSSSQDYVNSLVEAGVSTILDPRQNPIDHVTERNAEVKNPEYYYANFHDFKDKLLVL
jgi:hypothetical protein